MRGALVIAGGPDFASLPVGGKPELFREVEQLHRCGCREVHLLLLNPGLFSPAFETTGERETAFPHEASRRELTELYPFLSVHTPGAGLWTETIARLLEEKEGESLLLMQGGTVVQEEELLLFGQYASELMPDNYIGITAPTTAGKADSTESLVCLQKDRMRVSQIALPNQQKVPGENRKSAGTFAGMCCLFSTIVPTLREISRTLPAEKPVHGQEVLALLTRLVPQQTEPFVAYPFSQALHLCRKEQAAEAERLTEASFPLLLIEPETTENETSAPLPPQTPPAQNGLFPRIAYELRQRNQPCICSSEAHFIDLPFFFPTCFYAGSNPEVQELLDILAEEGCQVITPAALRLEEYLPTAKSMEEAIAKSLIDRCRPQGNQRAM